MQRWLARSHTSRLKTVPKLCKASFQNETLTWLIKQGFRLVIVKTSCQMAFGETRFPIGGLVCVKLGILLACLKGSVLFFSAKQSSLLALANRCFLSSCIKRGFLLGRLKLQVQASCKTRLPYASHFRSICFSVLHVTHITVAQCCVGWRRPCIKRLFFISLQGGCKWKHDCRAAALDVTGGFPNLFWLALLYASSGYISHAGNYAFWLEMRKFEMWKAHCVGGGAWMKEETRVPPESALLSGVIYMHFFLFPMKPY